MSNSGKKPTDDDEVEQILRATQDDMLLKLNVNSHMARASGSAAIDSDLDRRFQALKKPQKPAKADDATIKVTTKVDTAMKKVPGAAEDDDDLFARFTALKKSLPSQNRNESKSSFANDVSVNHEEEKSEEDEVEKIMKWAIDAARLDPSPPSDDDDSSDGDEDEDDGVDKKKKSKRK